MGGWEGGREGGREREREGGKGEGERKGGREGGGLGSKGNSGLWLWQLTDVEYGEDILRRGAIDLLHWNELYGMDESICQSTQE